MRIIWQVAYEKTNFMKKYKLSARIVASKRIGNKNLAFMKDLFSRVIFWLYESLDSSDDLINCKRACFLDNFQTLIKLSDR